MKLEGRDGEMKRCGIEVLTGALKWMREVDRCKNEAGEEREPKYRKGMGGEERKPDERAKEWSHIDRPAL